MTYRLELAEHFNRRVPVGTPVRYWSVRGITGGVHISHVRVLPAQVSERLREAEG